VGIKKQLISAYLLCTERNEHQRHCEEEEELLPKSASGKNQPSREVGRTHEMVFI